MESQTRDLSAIIQSVSDLMKLNGALYVFPSEAGELIDHVPLSVFPYSMTRQDYSMLLKVQAIWGILLHRLSIDRQLIQKMFKEASRHDQFVRRLLDCYVKTHDDRPQKIGCHPIRSDYLEDDNSHRYLLVQFNLIAVSLGCLSERIQQTASNYYPTMLTEYRKEGFPTFNNIKLIGQGMVQALKLANLSGDVMLITEQNERNRFDQRYIEYELLKGGYKTIRASMCQAAKHTKLDEQSRKIAYKGSEISLFYFRQGYIPKHYVNDECWKLRQNIERSLAISVPNVAMQLINFKRCQQQLSIDFMKKYISKEEAELISRCLAKMWNFEDVSQQKQLIEQTETGNYVLKPNREGGGNNIYGKNVMNKLKQIDQEQRKEYVLMERICPKPYENIFICNCMPQRITQSISELGFYSLVISNGDELVKNEVGGCLVRTKSTESDEGGVATGCSVLSSLYLNDK